MISACVTQIIILSAAHSKVLSSMFVCTLQRLISTFCVVGVVLLEATFHHNLSVEINDGNSVHTWNTSYLRAVELRTRYSISMEQRCDLFLRDWKVLEWQHINDD